MLYEVITKTKLLTYVQEKNLTLENSYSYADHVSDIDILQLAEHPVAVYPDRNLLKVAKINNWKIINT